MQRLILMADVRNHPARYKKRRRTNKCEHSDSCFTCPLKDCHRSEGKYFVNEILTEDVLHSIFHESIEIIEDSYTS